MPNMKVLIAASEAAPIIKLGGLGDVIGSLPKALEKLHVDADVIVPFFPIAKTQNHKVYKSLDLDVAFDNQTHTVEVHKTKLPGSNVDVFMLKNAKYFAMGGKSAFANNIAETEMFAFFNRAVVEFIKYRFNTYDLIHCNDWHTGFITHLLSDEIGSTRPATLLTIHNLSYQGVSSLDLLQEIGIDPGAHRIVSWDITDDDVNMMQQGVASADYLSTVSPSYATEILFKDIGGELSEVLQSRSGRIEGILNGIDYSQFPRDFSPKNWKSAKAKLKKDLQQKMNLNEDPKTPVYSFISRLDPNQKGLDILLESFSFFKESKAQFILLGTGDPEWEEKLKKEGDKNGLSINLKFDVDLALDIYKGSDFMLVPSRFEPCGLTQMISMWYGTLPIVHATGGLKDSVEDGVNGFSFKFYAPDDLQKALKNSLKVFKDSKKYDEMVQNAFDTDFSWEKSAEKYVDLYKKVIEARKDSLEF